MAKSTVSTARRNPEKPAKPRPDFPLFAHASGKWAKTIRGKTYYFGSWGDPHGAEDEYLAVADDLHAGRIPHTGKNAGGPSVKDVCNAFIGAKRVKLDGGQLSPRSFVDYDRTCKLLIDEFGGNRAVLDLAPKDFEKLYASLSKRFSPTSLKGEIVVVKMILKYACDADLIEHPVKFGPIFKAPSSTDLRKEKAKRKHAHGKRTFEAAEIRALLGKASGQLRAMILLGINCGYGNTDCANLPLSAVDLRRGWIDYPRPKTGAERRCPLWSETIQALQDVLAERKEAASPDHAGIVFVTRFGQPWVRYEVVEEVRFGKKVITPKQDDGISKGMTKLLKALGLKRPGVSFYSLRHTFETVAGGCRDQVAVDAIMGHIDGSMAGNYRHHIEDSRLQAVVDHVRAWLFAKS